MVHVQKKQKQNIISVMLVQKTSKYCCTMFKITWYIIACPHLQQKHVIVTIKKELKMFGFGNSVILVLFI